MTIRIFVGICWIIFVLFWTATASWSKPTVERQSWTSRFWYLVLLAMAAALLVGEPGRSSWNIVAVPPSMPWKILGGGLCLIGLLGAVWARLTIGRNWSGTVTFKEGHQLVVRGPYRLARHPIYTSMLLMFLGSAFAMGRLGSFAAFVLCGVSFWIKIGQEEMLLMRHFPNEYAAYRSRVKALIPFVI